jgi:hypothetical protein
MELKPCPYKDERHGGLMNVSALEQITRYLDPVLADIEAFRGLLPNREPNWADMFTAVIDQLARPAVYLLTEGGDGRPVPATRAVGHKLAAGFFDVLTGLLIADAQAPVRPVSVKRFLAFVKKRRALVGSGEVCAGPPHLITRVTEVFLHGGAEAGKNVDENRLPLARALAVQMALGSAWKFFDKTMEWEILLGGHGISRPQNPFIEREFKARVGELQASEQQPSIETASRLLHSAVAAAHRDWLTRRMAAAVAGEGCGDAAGLIEELIREEAGALTVTDSGYRAFLASALSGYLAAYLQAVNLLWEQEQVIRGCLGFSPNAPMKLNGLILPRLRSLRWFEAVLGYRVERPEPPARAIRLSKPDRAVSLPVTAE